MQLQEFISLLQSLISQGIYEPDDELIISNDGKEFGIKLDNIIPSDEEREYKFCRLNFIE